MYYVYLLKNSVSNKLYFGYTTNIRQRVIDHNKGKTRTTKTKGKWILVYYEAYFNKKDATQREWNLKHQGRQRDFLKSNIKNTLHAVIV